MNSLRGPGLSANAPGASALDPYGAGVLPSGSAAAPPPGSERLDAPLSAPHTAANRFTGVLLIVTGLLVVAASFLTLAEMRWSQYSVDVQLQAWQYVGISFGANYVHQDQTTVYWFGVAFVLSAATALVAGAVLLAGYGARSRSVRGWGFLSAGLVFGVTATAVFHVVSWTLADDRFEYSLGVGFWVLIVAVVVSVGAIVTALVGNGRGPARSERTPELSTNRVADLVAGAFLAFAAISALAGSLLSLIGDEIGQWSAWEYTMLSESSIQLLGVPLVLGGVLATAVAVLLFTGRGARISALRPLGSLAAGMIFGAALTIELVTVSQALIISSSRDFDSSFLGAGAWVLGAATLLSLGAVIVIDVSKTGRRAAM